MGLKGFQCPENGEEPGRNNSLNYCIKKCSQPCVAPHVLEAIYSLEKRNPHKDKRISVTMLCGGCARKTVLERTQDYYLEPDKKLPTFRGSMVHSVIEEAKTTRIKKAGWLIEHHMELSVKSKSGEWTLSGTLDAYDLGRESIIDTKTLQEYALEKMITGKQNGTWSKHIPDQYVLQQNIYKWMGKKLGLFDAKKLKLQAIGFGRMILTGTQVKWGKKGREELYTLPDIPILPDAEIEKIVETQGDKWYRILFLGQKAPVYDDGYEWLCRFCQFHGTEHCVSPKEEKALEKELKFGV